MPLLIAYRFRPNLFRGEQTALLDEAGVTLRGDGRERRLAWGDIAQVHIEPAIAGEDDEPRWLLNLASAGGDKIQIDSVNVRGTDDFEHKTDEFLAVLRAVHRSLSPRGKEVTYLFGMRKGVGIAWRIALVLVIVAGLMGVAAALYSGQWEAVFGALGMVALGVTSLSAMRNRGAPRRYDPGEDALADEIAPTAPQ
jgi:hypothetical protein